MSRKSPKSSVPPSVPAIAAPPGELRRQLPKGRTPAEDTAEMMVEGLAQNLIVTEMFSSMLPPVDVTEGFARTLTLTRDVVAGDRSGLEAILTAQVVACNAIFTDCVRRARLNYQNAEVHDRLLRLGLRAQGQCRATAESIAVMQAPPAVFAKQANIANGHQQVNNGTQPARVRAGESEVGPNKLLQAGTYVERIERVDSGAPGAAAASDSALEAVGPVNRSEKRIRKGAGGPKRVQGRHKAQATRGVAAAQRMARATR